MVIIAIEISVLERFGKLMALALVTLEILHVVIALTLRIIVTHATGRNDMDFAKAVEILKDMTGDKYISLGKGTVVLDDYFTIEQLEAIIIIMKGKK